MDRMRDREREDFFPNCHNSQPCVRLCQAEARKSKFLSGFPCGGRDPNTWAMLLSQVHYRVTELEVEELGLE